MPSRERRGTERRKSSVQVAKERRQGRTDRREAERIPLELWMEEVFGDDVYFRRTGNISTGGVYFDKAIPHDLGTVVTLKFALPGDKEMVVARGEVVNTTEGAEGFGMGIKFLSLESDGSKRLRAYLKTLS